MPTCPHCQSAFEIAKDDLAFYAKVSPIFNGKKELIPPPTLCPDCRMQKRMLWRNERSIHRSSCRICKRSMISQYVPESPHVAVCADCFWSKRCDPLAAGRPFDQSHSFFSQFLELLQTAPLVALINTNAQASEYCHRIYNGRNNYLSFIALYEPENLLHTYHTVACKDCTDVSVNHHCELCYETVDADDSYNCRYSRRIRNCRDSAFLEDCIGCSNCIGCKNLHQRQNCLFNEQRTPADIEAFRASMEMETVSGISSLRGQAEEFFRMLPNRPALRVNCESVSGAYVTNCKNCTDVYDLFECEELRHSSQAERSHHCMDCYGMNSASFCYEGITYGVDGCQNLLFSAATLSGCHNLLYCYDCYAGTHDCFGCVGLIKQSYCILNKQYSKEEYEELVPRIIERMRQAGEWGQFFPVHLSPFAYNESVAQDYFPLTKEDAGKFGWQWRDQKDDIPKVERIVSGAQLPDSIDETPDDILNWAIECEVTKRPFKIIRQELDFHRRMRLPLPRLHPDERYRRRMAQRNPRHLWKRKCGKCGTEIETTYSPERPESVYCEQCYLAAVY